MPFDKNLYPGWWSQFSRYIRFERAGNKCELCTAPNGKHVARGVHYGKPFWFDDDNGTVHSAINGAVLGTGIHDYELNIDRETVIVLTVAHLDHEGGPCDCKALTGRKCAIPDHVLALCQRCHLSLDMPKHIAERQKTLAIRKDAERPLLTQGAIQ
jgi:hypothetical protein